MKYKTLTELVRAYQQGDLNRDDERLVIDNDSTAAYERRDGTSTKVFEGGSPVDLLREALDVLNVPHEDA